MKPPRVGAKGRGHRGAVGRSRRDLGSDPHAGDRCGRSLHSQRPLTNVSLLFPNRGTLAKKALQERREGRWVPAAPLPCSHLPPWAPPDLGPLPCSHLPQDGWDWPPPRSGTPALLASIPRRPPAGPPSPWSWVVPTCLLLQAWPETPIRSARSERAVCWGQAHFPACAGRTQGDSE